MREFIKVFEAFDDRSSNFKRWFGNSKVVDEAGDPLQVYHGTGADIDSFKHSHGGAGSRESRLGFWFTDSALAAQDFAAFARKSNAGDNILPVYLSIKNPWYPESYAQIKDLIDRHTVFERKMILGDRNIRMQGDKVDYAGAVAEMRSNGYDGIILMNTLTDSPDGNPIHQYIVFDASQIKSVFNAGGYNPESEHISEGVNDKVILFHGSPHKFEYFDSSKISSGMLGWGVYLASDMDMASDFSRTRDGSGKIYRVAIPRNSVFINVNGRLSLQDKVCELLDAAGLLPKNTEMRGGLFYDVLAKKLGSARAASEKLASAGIFGNLDGDGGWSTVFVAFDPSKLEIVSSL